MATDIRAALKQVMLQTIADEDAHRNWVYEAIRPLQMPTTARKYMPGERIVGDCSKGCQYLSWWVPNCPDPMQSHFGLYGNSATIWLRSQHLDHPSELLLGDIVTFGRDGNEHAARVLEVGDDPLLWSFGHQGAPNTYRLSWDRRPHQLCRQPIPVYVPTQADRLRARTGWFAWVAWRLGEGDWLHYGELNPAVRPNVPTLIPPTWWTRLQSFLNARLKGDAAAGPGPTGVQGVE